MAPPGLAASLVTFKRDVVDGLRCYGDRQAASLPKQPRHSRILYLIVRSSQCSEAAAVEEQADRVHMLECEAVDCPGVQLLHFLSEAGRRN
jgi:hypothetical protein